MAKVFQEFEFNFKFNDKDASKSIKTISKDLKQMIANFGDTSDKMSILKDLVGYLNKVDASLNDLKTNNKDLFNQIFSSVDKNLTGALSELFGVLNSDMTMLDGLKQRIQDAAGNSKTKLEVLRKIAEDINSLFEKMGAQKPIDVSLFTQEGSKGKGIKFKDRIDILNNAIAEFAVNFKDVQQKLKEGFTVGGTGGFAGGDSGVEQEIKLLEQQINEYKKLIDIFKQLREVKSSLNEEDSYLPDEFAIDYDAKSIREAIQTYKEAMKTVKELSKTGDTNNAMYYDALATATKAAISLKDADINMYDSVRDSLKEVKIGKGTLQSVFGNVLDDIEDFFDESFNETLAGIPARIEKNIQNMQDRITKLKTQPNKKGGSSNGDSGSATGDAADVDKETEAYGRLQAAIEDVKAAVDEKTQAFRDEASTVDTVVSQEIESLKRLKEFLESVQEIIHEMFYGEKSSLNQADSIPTTFSDTIQTLTEGLEQVCQTIQNMPTAVGEFSDSLQSVVRILPDIVSEANKLKDEVNGFGDNIDMDALQSVADKLSNMEQSAQNLKANIGSLGDNLGAQGDSALNVKFGDTLQVDLTADSTGLLKRISDAVAAIQTKINAQGVDGKQAKVDAMKNNLTQLFKYVSDVNSKKKPDGTYQGQEIGAAILSDGSISTGFGEKGTVPWKVMASSLVGNLAKTLLMDLHSHPLHQFGGNTTYVSDWFSGSTGDWGAFRNSKQLGAQLASMLTGNIMRVLDLSKLSSTQMNQFQLALAKTEKRYGNDPQYKKYINYNNKTGKYTYNPGSNLSEQHEVTAFFEQIVYDAFKQIGISKDQVDAEIVKKYDLTDEQQLTSLAERLVDLTLASQNALSPVERLAQIVNQFGYTTNSQNAKSILEGFKKGELTAADAFNQLTNDNYHINQDTMKSLFTIDSANEMSTVESLLTQIIGTLEAIKSNVVNIDGNTNRNSSEQIDRAMSDIIDVKERYNNNGYKGINESLIAGVPSSFDPRNISEYQSQDMAERAANQFTSFTQTLGKLTTSMESLNTSDMQNIFSDFKTTWRALNDAIDTLTLYKERTGQDYVDSKGQSGLQWLKTARKQLLGNDNLDLILQMLSKAKTQIEAEKGKFLSSGESSNDQSSIMNDLPDIEGLLKRIADAVDGIKTVVQADTGIESDGKNSIKQKEPVVDNRAEQNKLSEQDLAVLGELSEVLSRLNEYLTSSMSNNTPEDAEQNDGVVSNIYQLLSSKLSSQLASERTLGEIRSIVNLLLDKSKIEKDLATKATQYSDLQSFVRNNIDALKAIGVSNNTTANALWRDANYKREDFQPVEIAMEDVADIIRNKVPENILDGWFKNADSSYKPRLENIALSNKDVRNAALNVMWNNYKEYSKKDIGFKDFLYSNIPVYRGKNQEKYTNDDQVLSFTFDKSVAEKFGKHIFETMIRPIDTIGSYQTTAEGEVMVRRDFLEQLPEFQTWLNNMSSGLTQSFVQATSRPSDIQGGSDYALEVTLQAVKGILDKIAGDTGAILNKIPDGTNVNPVPPDTSAGAGATSDQQNNTDSALVGTLKNIESVLGQILTALTDGKSLSTLVQPLSDAVSALKDVSNGIIQHQKAQKSDTRIAQARIADPIQQDLIVEKAKDAVQSLGTDVQVASLDALADGIVRVSGAVKNANGIWEGFTIKVNQADEAVDLSIKKQSAFAKSLNKMDKLSGGDDEDSNPYVYDKAEVEARARKHLDEYAAQGKNATVQFKDSGRYTITILEEIDGLSKQIFQTFDENDDKIERTTVTMSNSQKEKLDRLQKKLIDNGITNGLISDQDKEYQDYQAASDALNNMTDAYSKMDSLTDEQIAKWKQQIALVQQLGGQVEALIQQRKLANDTKIFESDRSKKLSKFDLDRAKLQKDINIPESFKQQIEDARMAIANATDEDALKIAINNWEALKNQIHQTAVQQDLYIEKAKNTNTTPDQFTKDLKSQKTSFSKYKRDVEDAIDVTDELKNRLKDLETELANINDDAGLSAWQKKFSGLKAEIAATQSSYKRDKNQYSQQVMGQANAGLKSAGIKKDSANPTEDQQKIIDKYKELEEQINKYNEKVQAKQQAETSGVEQTKAALLDLIAAYKQANNIVDAKGNPSKQAYGTAQLPNFSAKYNSLQDRAQGVGLGEDYEAVKNLADAYQRLKEVQSQFQVGEDLTTEAGKQKVEEFKRAQIECNRYAQELNKVVTQEEKLRTNSISGSPVAEDFKDDIAGRKKALEDFVNAIPSTAVGKFNADFTELTYTVKNGDGTFTNMTATLNAARSAIFATAGETEKATTAFGKFWNELKGKMKGIATYLLSMTGFQEVWQQIRQGVQYVREIDAALTELKKVTDETNATYDAFLQTMSKTAGEVGSTVSELTTMAAEWARLGYSIEDAGKLAESTAILLNVSEFESATDASQALISTMQAFGYIADDSQHVVDILNEVGNNFAVSSDGLATALQDSASALMEGGNNLEQSVALIAAANKVVNLCHVIIAI